MKLIEKTMIRQVNDRADASCLNLGLGEPGFRAPRAVVAHVREHLSEWDLGYSPNEGLKELRELIAERESSAGCAVRADRVFVTVGSEEAVFVLTLALVDPGDEVLIPDPGFPAYPSIVRLAGGIPVPYPLMPENGFRLKATDLLARVTPRTRAAVVNSPNNPTGAVYEDEEWAALAAGLAGSGVAVLSDECYRALTFGKLPPSPFRHYENTIRIDSLSKSHCMTGWRLGWMVLPEGLAPRLGGIHQLAVMCAPVVSQRAAIFALRGGADEELAANLAEWRKRRDLALECLKSSAGLQAAVPQGTFYLFAAAHEECRRAGGSLALCLRLIEEEKVVVIPGAAFGARGEGYLRLSFAAAPETIEAGLERLGRFLDRLRAGPGSEVR